MNDITEVIEHHPAGETAGRFRFECAGGAVGVEACSDRLTPYGTAAAWCHYLEKLGVVTDLARRFPFNRTSPNATLVGDVIQAFMFNCQMRGRRFAHARREVAPENWTRGIVKTKPENEFKPCPRKTDASLPLNLRQKWASKRLKASRRCTL